MIEQAVIKNNLSDTDIYESVLPIVENFISAEEPVISSLSNITALLKEAFTKISWAGFYLLKQDTLYVGPFQGKVACSRIPAGKGVCGTSVLKKQTIIVNDVAQFPEHIACDSNSRSEIVVPLVSNGIVYGVLDLDSTYYSAFNETDKVYLEMITGIITGKIDLEKLKNIVK